MTTTVDFVADFGAPINGTSDSAAAVAALNTYMLSHNDVILTVPAHTYVIYSSVRFAESAGAGTKLVVQATGATFSNAGHTSAAWFLGGHGLSTQGGPSFRSSARIASVSAGATAVTLLTIGDAALFTVGRWVLVAALDMQGTGSGPQNPFSFEYRKVVGINGAIVSFEASLRYSYLAIFPTYDAGDAFGPDQGGPATIYVLPASWDVDVEYIGLTVNNIGIATYVSARKVKFTGVTCLDPLGIIPSQNSEHIWDGCDFSACSVEVDKLVERLYPAGNLTTVNQLNFQSSCIGSFESTGGLNVLTNIVGTPRTSTLNNVTTPSLRIAPTSYGRCDSFSISNSTVSAFSGIGVTDTDITNPANGFTLTNGVISRPNSFGPIRWAIPGTFVMFKGSRENETGFTVTSVTSDGTTTFVGTTLSGSAWPSVPLQGGTALALMAHPGPIIYASNCTGCPDIVDLCNDGAQGKPLYAYSKRSYTGNTLVSPPGVHLWGRLTQIKVAVSQAFTGTGALTLKPFNQFAPNALDPNNSATTWNLTLNLKVAGTRIITPTVVTGTQSGDTLTAPGLIWFDDICTPFASADISGQASNLWPIVEIEVMTDQLFQRQVVPLGLRLAA